MIYQYIMITMYDEEFCQANIYLNVMNSNVMQNHKQHFFELGQTIFLNLNLLWENFDEFEMNLLSMEYPIST